jgi:hypothetical protein
MIRGNANDGVSFTNVDGELDAIDETDPDVSLTTDGA